MIHAPFLRLPVARISITLAASVLVSVCMVPALLAQVPPVPGGEIGTLARGKYECELPGDAGGTIGERLPELDFKVVNASSYKNGGARGSYLLTGSKVVMTGGKLRGMRFDLVSTGFLRQAGDEPIGGRMRCIRVSKG